MEKVRRKNSRHYIDNMSIKNSFVFYALISLVIGIVIGVISITLVDDYRINLNYKYEDMKSYGHGIDDIILWCMQRLMR